MAWMASAPKPDNSKEKETPTRAQRIEANGGEPLMPEPGDAAYLLGYWQAAGWCGQGFNGPVPMTAAELRAWSEGAGIELDPWQFQTVLEMSRAWVNESHAADKMDCPPPYGDPAQEFDRAVVSKKLRGAFQAFIQSERKH